MENLKELNKTKIKNIYQYNNLLLNINKNTNGNIYLK